MSERKLASIQKIVSKKPIEGADLIEAVHVLGWWLVTKKDEFQVGDSAVYFEVDSFIPTELAPFLSKGKEPREFNGVKGERLRTMKLKGQISQGLLLPVSILTMVDSELFEGLDVTFPLGIQKYEKPIPASLSGLTKGSFPSFIPKTDAERCQNLVKEIQQYVENEIEFEITMKLDGSSFTVAKNGDEFYVCSRNLSLKLDQEGNAFVDAAKKYDLQSKLESLGRNIAIQGELIGPSIQNNQEKLTSTEVYVFEMFDIDNQCYIKADERRQIAEQLGLKHVPVLESSVTLKQFGATSIDQLLLKADGESLNPNAKREGIVFKSQDGSIKFKAISNSWLLKNE